MMRNKGFTPLEKTTPEISDMDRLNSNDNLKPLLLSHFTNLRNKFPNKIRKDSLTGFTLIELVAVVIILAILASVSIPIFRGTIEKSRQAEAITILTRMYKGYKILIIDEQLNPSTDNFYNTTVFNPDESNILPNNPIGRSDMSWKSLGFKENPNYESSNLYFSYDFLKAGESSWDRPDSQGTKPTVPSGSPSWGIAYRKLNNTWIAGMELYPVDYDRRIIIYMNNATIVKSSHYQ